MVPQTWALEIALNIYVIIISSHSIFQYRCIFIEFTVYNANANLFTNFVFGFEFDNYGGPFPFKRISTSRLYHYDKASKYYLQSMEVGTESRNLLQIKENHPNSKILL